MTEQNTINDLPQVDPVMPIPADGEARPAVPDDAPITIIEAKKGWLPIDFHELVTHRELLFFLIWRDVKVRYKQTVLGASWAIIQPVFSMVIFSIIFGSFAKMPSDGIAYPVFVYAALLPWTFFANAVSSAGLSLVSQTNLLTKIYFPRLYMPISAVGVGVVDLALSFAVYVLIVVYYVMFQGTAPVPGASILLLPGLVLLTIFAACGMGFLLASITVVYRDFRHIVPFMMQAWMYATPVVYPMSMLPEKYRPIMALNPMAGIIGGYRSVLLNQTIDWQNLAISAAVACGLFIFGMYNFRRTERFLADVA